MRYLLFFFIINFAFCQKVKLKKYTKETSEVFMLIRNDKFALAKTKNDILYKESIKANDSFLLARAYNNYGIINSATGKTAAAIAYFNKAKNVHLKMGDSVGALSLDYNLFKARKKSENALKSSALEPIVVKYDKLKNINFFRVLNTQIICLFEEKQYKLLVEKANQWLDNLAHWDFKNLPKAEVLDFTENLKYRIMAYKGYSLINLGKYKQGYELLNKVKTFHLNLNDFQANKTKSDFNYYLSVYFLEQFNKDSLRYYTDAFNDYSNLVYTDFKNKFTVSTRELMQNQYDSDLKDIENRKNLEIATEKTITQVSVVFFVSLMLLVFIYFKFRQKLKNKEIASLKAKNEFDKLNLVIKGEEQEKKRISQELHDGVNGDLTVIKHKLASINKEKIDTETKNSVSTSINVLDEAMNQIRSISHYLTPLKINDNNLIDGIRDYCDNLSGPSTVFVCFESFGDTNIDISVDTKTAVYRIIQELLSNVIKHSKAKRANVQVSFRENKLTIVVEDDGVGYDVATKNEGIGLKNIKDRIDFLKANFNVLSDSDGTTVTITIDNLV